MEKRSVLTVFGRPMAAVAALLLATGALANDVTLDVRPENRRILIPGPGEGTLQIQVVAPDLPPAPDRPKLNLAVVIDRSGSMADARKLEFVKTAVHQLVDMMGPDDVLALVAYDHQVQVSWPACRIDGHRDGLHRIVSSLYPGGRTFLSGGLEEGFRQAHSARKRGYVSRVILFSDGLANVGVTSRGALRDRAAMMSGQGVSISTFGVGYDFDEELLAMTAAGGGGNYEYLGDPERIATALAREFRTASRIAAAEVEIIIRLRPGCRFGTVLGREWKQEGDTYVIRLGDLSAGERRTVFAGLSVDGARPGRLDVGEVTLRYLNPATAKRITAAARPVALEVVRDETLYREGYDKAVKERKAVVQSGVLVQEAARLADQGKKEKAQELLGKAEAGLAAAPASPAVQAEMQRAGEYRNRLDSLTEMHSEEAKEVQKSIKYRSYEILNRQ